MMLRKLRLELVNQVEEWFYELVFCPGYVYLLGKPPILEGREARAWAERRNMTARPALLTLSRGIHARYEERMYTENTFVIGTSYDSGRLLAQRLVVKHWQEIRKFDIVFGFRERLGSDISKVPATPEELLAWWWLKFSVTERSTPPTHLALDFSMCYDDNGRTWFGYELALKLGTLDHYFGRHSPIELKVYAPDVVQEQDADSCTFSGWDPTVFDKQGYNITALFNIFCEAAGASTNKNRDIYGGDAPSLEYIKNQTVTYSSYIWIYQAVGTLKGDQQRLKQLCELIDEAASFSVGQDGTLVKNSICNAANGVGLPPANELPVPFQDLRKYVESHNGTATGFGGALEKYKH
ncbi:MAG: hypothetical protein Q9213_006688 [Squamulea squamosa]